MTNWTHHTCQSVVFCLLVVKAWITSRKSLTTPIVKALLMQYVYLHLVEYA